LAEFRQLNYGVVHYYIHTSIVLLTIEHAQSPKISLLTMDVSMLPYLACHV